MTVWTQELQVRQRVVRCIAVDVIHLKYKRLTVVPRSQTAASAFVAMFLDHHLTSPARALEADMFSAVLTIHKRFTAILRLLCVLTRVVAVAKVLEERFRTVKTIHNPILSRCPRHSVYCI